MEYLSTDKILVIDLGTGDIEQDEIDEGLVQEKIGGIGMTTYLYEKYENSPVGRASVRCSPKMRLL